MRSQAIAGHKACVRSRSSVRFPRAIRGLRSDRQGSRPAIQALRLVNVDQFDRVGFLFEDRRFFGLAAFGLFFEVLDERAERCSFGELKRARDIEQAVYVRQYALSSFSEGECREALVSAQAISWMVCAIGRVLRRLVQFAQKLECEC